jgi:hypothetical protein
MPIRYLDNEQSALPPKQASGRIRYLDDENSQQIGYGEDAAKTISGIPARAVIRAGMIVPDLANAAVAGPQYLYEGIIGKDRPDFQPYQPFYGSEDAIGAVGLYQPQTGLGQAIDIAANVFLGSKVGKMANKRMTREAGVSTPESVKSLDIIPEAKLAAKKTAKVNPVESGIRANQAISRQYDFDTSLQRQLYAEANKIGKVYSIETPELYKKMDDIVGYLEGKVAVDTPEFRALTELKDIRSGMQTKYGKPEIPDTTSSIVDEFSRPIVTRGQQAVSAKGVEPADLIEIKTVLNSGLKPNKFATSGSTKIIELKKYVSNALKDASAAKPEFGKALKLAEKQAGKVGLYKEDSLRQLWQPEDYLAFRAGGELPADTINRASQLLQNINTKATGKISNLSKILPREQAKQIVKEAFRYGKQKKPNLLKAATQVISRQPVSATRTAIESVTTPAEMPLDDLAKYIARMQQGRYMRQPAPNYNQNLGTAMGAQAILNAINGGY